MGETESGIVCGLPSEDSGSSCRQRVAKERTRLASVHNDDIRRVPFGLIEHLVILSESKQRIRIPTTPQKVFLSLTAAVDCGYRAESLKNGQGRDPTICYANVRMDFSRSHWRVFAAAINASSSLASTTPASCPTFANFKSASPPLSMAIALRWPKASRTKSIAAPSLDSSLEPSSE